MPTYMSERKPVKVTSRQARIPRRRKNESSRIARVIKCAPLLPLDNALILTRRGGSRCKPRLGLRLKRDVGAARKRIVPPRSAFPIHRYANVCSSGGAQPTRPRSRTASPIRQTDARSMRALFARFWVTPDSRDLSLRLNGVALAYFVQYGVRRLPVFSAPPPSKRRGVRSLGPPDVEQHHIRTFRENRDGRPRRLLWIAQDASGAQERPRPSPVE
jgi:hypothetical protein